MTLRPSPPPPLSQQWMKFECYLVDFLFFWVILWTSLHYHLIWWQCFGFFSPIVKHFKSFIFIKSYPICANFRTNFAHFAFENPNRKSDLWPLTAAINAACASWLFMVIHPFYATSGFKSLGFSDFCHPMFFILANHLHRKQCYQ